MHDVISNQQSNNVGEEYENVQIRLNGILQQTLDVSTRFEVKRADWRQRDRMCIIEAKIEKLYLTFIQN